MRYFKMPLDWNAITTYFSPTHLAIDLGWSRDHGGSNVDVFSCSDGDVVFAGDTYSTAGIMVKVRFDDKENNTTWYFQYKHLSSINVKQGEKIKMGMKVGNMGGTGGYAPHLHLDVVKCPYGYVYEQEVSDNRKKYSVNPLDYCFLYPGQEVNDGSKNNIFRLIGSDFKTNRDVSENQIQVVGYKLRCRNNYGLDGGFLGYIDYGIYNYDKVEIKDGYSWYRIKDNMWIAGTKEDTIVYEKVQDDCSSYKNKISVLENKIIELEKYIKELKSDNDYLVFAPSKSDYYYIYLDKDDEFNYKIIKK